MKSIKTYIYLVTNSKNDFTEVVLYHMSTNRKFDPKLFIRAFSKSLNNSEIENIINYSINKNTNHYFCFSSFDEFASWTNRTLLANEKQGHYYFIKYSMNNECIEKVFSTSGNFNI